MYSYSPLEGWILYSKDGVDEFKYSTSPFGYSSRGEF
jgi:hypothetical protein